MKKIIFFFCFIVLIINQLYAQDPVLSLPWAMPISLNPAYTGGTRAYRFIAHNRSQWLSGQTASYNTQLASFDMFTNVGLGLGAIVSSDQQGQAGLLTNQASALFSYEVAFNKVQRIRFGVQVGMARRQLRGDLLLANNISPYGVVSTGLNDPILNGTAYDPFLQTAAGMIYGSNDWSVGVAVHHLNQPLQYSLDQRVDRKDIDRLKAKYTIHGGKLFQLDQGVKSIRLDGSFSAQDRYRQAYLASQFFFVTRESQSGKEEVFEQFFIGPAFRGLSLLEGEFRNDAVILMGGYAISRERSIITFSLGYDMTVSQLGWSNTAGSIEGGISIAFKNAVSPTYIWEPVPLFKKRGQCEDYLRWPNRKYNHTMLVPAMERASDENRKVMNPGGKAKSRKLKYNRGNNKPGQNDIPGERGKKAYRENVRKTNKRKP